MKKILKAALCILKNATIVIPLLEGVIDSIMKVANAPTDKCISKDCKDVESKEVK